ncbi:DUF732 domain-containing protein [Mycobacterium sp. 1423905.2]|uniref:DUF732 domain-containing protein n=1 Tax=Mycobacterium sp. 1423905.2 TaxID=1856859 RepID=UPI0007FCBBEC|nr:DUF732 domain-containing protein [Mycobacterium sp. 1423905.2]OBJ49386.1 hypothetical protein A9W95_02170 [Mycobacterium sp. 1423905.2]
MFSPRITAGITTALAAGAVGIAVATAGAAGASTTDDAFIARMASVGVTFSSPQAAAQDGHHVCSELASGKSGTEVAKDVLNHTDLTSKQAAYLVVNATNAYCPQYASQLT